MRVAALSLSVLVIFLIPIEATITLGGFGSATRLAGLLLIMTWLLLVIVSNKIRRPHLFHFAIALFVLWNACSIFWSLDAGRTFNRLVTYAQLVALSYILWDLYLTPAMIQVGMQAYVLGAYLSVGGTIYNFAMGNDVSGRFGATGFNLNDIGLILALGLPVSWYLATNARADSSLRFFRLLNYAYIPAAFFSIVLTASRGSLIASLPVFLYILWTFHRLRPLPRLVIFVAIVGSLFTLQSLVPESSVERLSTASTSIASGNLNGRVAIWEQGLDVFAERPLLGVGAGAFREAIDLGRAPHNTFVSVLVDLGLVGLLLFLGVLATVVYQLFRQHKWEFRMWSAVLLIWTLGVMVHNWEQKKPTWLFLNLVVVSANVVSGYAPVQRPVRVVREEGQRAIPQAVA